MRHLATRFVGERVGGSISRTIVEQVDDTKLMQFHTLSGFSKEQQQNIEHVHPYGFTSVVQAPSGSGQQRNGAEGFMGHMSGGRSHGVVFVAGDRRFRLMKLQNGEVAMHDDQGHQVHFQRDGIWASAPNSKKIVLQLMDDDKMPQDSGKNMGQIKQAGRASSCNVTLTKDSLVVNHTKDVIINAGGKVTITAGDKMTINAASMDAIISGNLNLKGGSVFTVGKTYLGVDNLSEVVIPLVPDVDLDPAKQTYVKIS